LETVLTTLTRGQARAGDRVCVAAVLSEGEGSHPFVEGLASLGVDAVPLRLGGRSYLEERRRVMALLQERGADVLHTHGYRSDVVGRSAARRVGVPVVATVHGFIGNTLRGRIYEWIQRRVYRSFDGVVAVSAKLRSELVASGVPSERLHVVRNAWEPAGELATRADARATLGIGADEVVIGWVGRLGREKGPDVMVRAFAALSRRDPILAMIGSGDMVGSSQVLAGELGVGDRVRFHGVVPDAGRMLRAFDVLAMSSWTEGTPMVLLEAMASGVPVVATGVGGIPDVVGPEEAILVPPGDPAALAEAMAQTLGDPARAAARASRASARLARDFAVDAWVQRYRSIYLQARKTR
jgi:glycosyltransferase involved in cell wall biosynthesis